MYYMLCSYNATTQHTNKYLRAYAIYISYSSKIKSVLCKVRGRGRYNGNEIKILEFVVSY